MKAHSFPVKDCIIDGCALMDDFKNPQRLQLPQIKR